MAYVILHTACMIAGEPHQPGEAPIEVSSTDAKLLVSMKLATPAEAPAPIPVATPAPVKGRGKSVVQPSTEDQS